MTTSKTPTDDTARAELRHALLLFDKSRAQTGIRYINGHITKDEADQEQEADIARVVTLIAQHTDRVLKEIVASSPTRPLVFDDRYYFEIGREVVRRVEAHKSTRADK